MKKAKGKLIALGLSFLLMFIIAGPVLAADLPLMPMVIMGEAVDKNGSEIAEGALKVFVGEKPVTEVPINKGQVDVVLDAMDESNLSTIGRDDLGKKVSFEVTVDGKKYEAVAAKGINFQEGVLEGSDARLLITVNCTSCGSGQPGNGSGGQNDAPAAPVAKPAAGNVEKGTKIELSSTTAQAVIYYTTDNTDPSSSATRKEYSEPISIEKDTVIKAVSVKSNIYSKVAVFNYTIGQPGQSNVQLTDIQGHWASEVIQKMVQQGVIAGYEDKTFRPDKLISRVECSAIIARALDLGTGDTQNLVSFSDASDIPDWAKGSVAAAVSAGLLKGYPGPQGKSIFLPQQQITRVELAAILSRVITAKLGPQTVQKAQFADGWQIPEWAAEAVDIAASKGLIKGYPDGTFQPKKNITRAEAATMIDRLMEALK